MVCSLYFDKNLFNTCTPSVIINLIGMLFGNQMIKEASENSKINDISFLLQCSCILSMKNSIELAYALNISTTQKNRANINSYITIKTILISIQSILIGVLIGIITIVSKLLKNEITKNIFIQIIYTSITVCFLSTIAFIISFLIADSIITYFKIDSENFVMPILCTVNDNFVIKILTIISKSSYEYNIKNMLFLIFLELCFFLTFLIYFWSYDSNNKIYLGKIWACSICINIFTGFIVDDAAKDFPIINQTYHLYSNICSSISYIYSHKAFLALKSRSELADSLNHTLILIATFCSFIYMIISQILKLDVSFLFLIGLIMVITMQTTLINSIINFLYKFPDTKMIFASSNISVFIASLSDLASICSIILISLVFVKNK